MKKIGFIDYELDNWHANNYPQMIREASGGTYEVAYAWAYQDRPGGMSNREWAETFGAKLMNSPEEVIEAADVLVVLAPNDPQMHELLCQKPLASGKRTYVDKTFAPDKASAERIFANAEAHGTPCFSTSALRFSQELDTIDTDAIETIYSEGPGTVEIYSIHQIEPLVRLMKTRVTRLMALAGSEHPSFVIEFEDGRRVQMVQRDDPSWGFRMQIVDKDNAASIVNIESNYFDLFIKEMIRFFDTGIIPVPHEQTIDVCAIRATALEAVKRPFEWVEVNR
ncbi:MAG: NAD(P)-dependent oxidoreductase [Lachnospiraceae bacterium]|nr:NAD(P)-dependent oxidoreductase [Lachnospiraceae bacterium]